MTNLSKNTTSYSNQSKNTTDFLNQVKKGTEFLLQEDTFFLLLEDGGKIVLKYGDENYTYLTKH